MLQWVYGGLAALLAAGVIAALWALINGLWHRKWGFAAGAALVALALTSGALNMWTGATGGRPYSDDNAPRIR